MGKPSTINREIDEDESLNWNGAQRSHIARYQIQSRLNKYSTCDLVQVVEKNLELHDKTDSFNPVPDGDEVIIGGIQNNVNRKSLISYNQTYLLNNNQRNSSKERYNNDFNRSCIGKVNSCSYDKDCIWNKNDDSGCAHTAFVVQYVGTNNYSIFDCTTGTSYLCKNMTGAKSLSPGDVVVAELSGDILERLSYLHTGGAYRHQWRHDMERVIRRMELTLYEKSVKLFPWCYESIRSSGKLFRSLTYLSPEGVRTTLTDKQQHRRAHLGLQLLMCEVNACALVESVCPAPRPIDRFLQGTVFDRDLLNLKDGRGLSINPARRRPDVQISEDFNVTTALSQALWMDFASGTDMFRTLSPEALRLIYSFHAVQPFSFAFKEMLFQSNQRYGSVVKNVSDVGSLKGRPHLAAFCHRYASHWKATRNTVSREK